MLLNIPTDNIREFDGIESIDEAAEKLDSSMEIEQLYKFQISPETEFWGHCSNLQAWYENNYDTRLIHRNLAFPLLKALVNAGDPLAKKVFKEEIAIRLESGYPSVVMYLINQNYLKYLHPRELNTVIENPDFIKNILKYNPTLDNIPQWLYIKIRNLIPKKESHLIIKPDFTGRYDATYKIVLLGDSDIGKVEFTQRFLTNLFKSDSRMTIGVDFEVKSVEVDDYRVNLQIWDFGGEERFRFLLPTYVRGANGALFMYDVNNYSSLAHIDDWLMVIRKELRQEDIFPVIVVGLVSGINAEREVLAEEGINIAKSRGVDGFIECSLRTGENVEATFEELTRLMLANSGLR